MNNEAERLAAEYTEENSKNAAPIVAETPIETTTTVVETPITEVIAEAVAPAATTEVVEEETKTSLFESIDSLDQTIIAEEKAVVDLPENIKAQLAEFEALKAERLAEENSDIAKLKKSGLTLAQIAEKITKVDYSSFKTPDLIKMELQKAGLEGEELDAAIEEEVTAYSSLSPLQKAKYDSDLKANYKTEVKIDDALSLLDEALKNNQTISPEEYAKKQAAVTEANIKADTEVLDKYLVALKTKGEIDEETVTAIKGSYSFDKSVAYLKGDKFDGLSFIKDQYKILNYEKAVAEAEKRGFDKAAKKFGSPEQHGGGGGINTEKTPEQIYEEAMAAANKPRY